MDVAVLGGGLQGCCVALLLAARGKRVCLFEREESLLSRTAIANEGKIHLGYVYAGDRSMRTARLMIEGALAFAPFLQRHAGLAADTLNLSSPGTYAVHRDSQLSDGDVGHYYACVHRLLREAAAGRENAYFGIDLASPPRRWSSAEVEAEFDPLSVTAAFATEEVSVEPVGMAARLRDVLAAEPRIEISSGRTVERVSEDGDRLLVYSRGSRGSASDRFDHVVNALWDGRPIVDASFGLPLDPDLLQRFKYGVIFTAPQLDPRPPTTTFALGPFGDVVCYGAGAIYLSWYPAAMRAMTVGVAAPDLPMYPTASARVDILGGCLSPFSKLMPKLRGLAADAMDGACVKGGVVFARGRTDIVDPASDLHARFRIGVQSVGHYHSIDPGKLTMAPYFAQVCADRIG